MQTNPVCMTILPEMYLLTRKLSLNFGSRLFLGHKDPKKMKNFNLAALFLVYHCKWPHPLATVACSTRELFIADDIIVHPAINK